MSETHTPGWMQRLLDAKTCPEGAVASALTLTGNAYDRGRAQIVASPDQRDAIEAAIKGRLGVCGDRVLQSQRYLSEQWDFLATGFDWHLDQIRGIAAELDMLAEDVFAYLHASLLDDADSLTEADGSRQFFVAVCDGLKKPAGTRVSDNVDDIEKEYDGCSVQAYDTKDTGPTLAKNRDYQGEHRNLQRVMVESDPAWGDKRIISVGSLGSPGAFSSGMNSAGLAVADTRIGWRQPGVGWLRYLLMNQILVGSSTVDEALEFMDSQPHAGGGSLVLVDAEGCSAGVELPAYQAVFRTGKHCGIAQTNHFQTQDLANMQTLAASDPDNKNSRARLAVLESCQLDDNLESSTSSSVTDIVRRLSSHGNDMQPALCNHDKIDSSQTISTSVYLCRSRQLLFCPGNPCSAEWQRYVL